ncbi:MAG: DUF2304 domain-containing protein [Clostridia bacterium]|nr:DUF2304 domain-containing protein [Clostridia bacterium]
MSVNIFYAIVGIMLAIYILNSVKNNKFDIGESIIWILGTLVIIILAIFPNLMTYLANSVGIEYAPSLFFLMCIIFLLLINFRNTKKISKQQEKIVALVQELSIIKNKLEGENKNGRI